MSSPAPAKTEGPTFDEQIEMIMDLFDDIRVARVMDELDMRWPAVNPLTDEPEMRVPLRREIRQTARRLLGEMAGREGDGQCTSCGFLVMKWHGRLALYFIPASADTFDV